MITVERQVHGYRQGHQLLASSVQLPKIDQAIIDRLSDVAGPLRPKEQFSSYLSAYPLPSGAYYVLARTWQDTFVARAGCVRTLSLLIPSDRWATASGLSNFLQLLEVGGLPGDDDASSRVLQDDGERPLPPAADFRASELLEALFLEETKPVAIFDAPQPEMIAVRLLTALWPNLRRRFALSTFALSPRKVSGRYFDLVFAPKDARSKFADWPGRRVDGRATQDARHKWTQQIVRRVFEDPRPRLLRDDEVGLVDGADESDYAASLRIVLLWGELSGKLAQTPSAALGLLDIANSGMVRDSAALTDLERDVSRAVRSATASFDDGQAWDFLGAIIRKMQERTMPEAKLAVASSVRSLSGRSPAGALSLLTQADLKGAIAELLPSISQGIAESFGPAAEHALINAPPALVGRLVASDDRLAKEVADDPILVDHLMTVLSEAELRLIGTLSRALVPQLSRDWQAPLARSLLDPLSTSELAAQIERLGRTTDFSEQALPSLLIEEARKKGGLPAIRGALNPLPRSEGRDRLIAQTLAATPDDVAWLLHASDLPTDRAQDMLAALLSSSTQREIVTLFSDQSVGTEVISSAARSAPAVLSMAVLSGKLPYPQLKDALNTAFNEWHGSVREELAVSVLPALLRLPPDGGAQNLLSSALTITKRLDGPWLVRAAFGLEISAAAASRNMVAFDEAASAIRAKVVGAVAEIADALVARHAVDLDAAAVLAYANLMADAETSSYGAVLRGAGRLLPALMRQRRDPVSPVIVIMFAAIYRELAKEDDVPDLLKFVPFWDWDRCKAARQELVSAFMSSSWPPSDLALTACRCGDVDRILRRTAKAYGGDAYIDRIADDIRRLPPSCRKAVSKGISTLKSDWAAKYDWRD